MAKLPSFAPPRNWSWHRITALGDTHWLRNFPSGKFSPTFPQYKPPHWAGIVHISVRFYGCTRKSAVYMPRTLISLVATTTSFLGTLNPPCDKCCFMCQNYSRWWRRRKRNLVTHEIENAYTNYVVVWGKRRVFEWDVNRGILKKWGEA